MVNKTPTLSKGAITDDSQKEPQPATVGRAPGRGKKKVKKEKTQS